MITRTVCRNTHPAIPSNTLSLSSRGTVIGQWRQFAKVAALHNHNRAARTLKSRTRPAYNVDAFGKVWSVMTNGYNFRHEREPIF